jgi:hypothetical protein
MPGAVSPMRHVSPGPFMSISKGKITGAMTGSTMAGVSRRNPKAAETRLGWGLVSALRGSGLDLEEEEHRIPTREWHVDIPQFGGRFIDHDLNRVGHVVRLR